MTTQTLFSTKKIFFYNFFPTKAEEDSWKGGRSEGPAVPILHDRMLIEMRDIYMPRVVDPDNPWAIKKTLDRYEALSGMLFLSSNDVLEHVVRYWPLSMARYLVDGQGAVCVVVLDVTEEKNPKKYDNPGSFYMHATTSNYFVFSCVELVRARECKVGDEVFLYWDVNSSSFKLKVKEVL